MKKAWLWLAVLLAVLAVACAPWPPTRFGAAFFGGLAVCCGAEEYFWRNRRKNRLYRWISGAGLVLFTLFVVSFGAVQGLISRGAYADAVQPDYVFVLGARVYEDGEPSLTLAWRCDRAVDYLTENPSAKAVLCGGQGDNEPIPEAEAMQTYLLAQGVPADRLILEEASRNTIQNIQNGKKLLDDLGKPYTTAVITSDFHCARARRLMQNAGLDAAAISAKTPYLAQRIVLRCREYGSIMGLVLTGRW